ncbi:MAG: VOC family protein [Chloroflexota bacterium]
MTNDALSSSLQFQNTIKPLIITKNTEAFIPFIEKVFGAQEVNKVGRTVDDDGLLLHSEFEIGNATVIVIDSKDGWIFTPSFLWVFVKDVESTLQIAKGLGASIITKPTAFYGDIFSRIQDPWNNLWWVYEYGEGTNWDDEESNDESWSTEPDQTVLNNLNYIYATLMKAMKGLA